MKKIAIVGGGIAGLAAAYELELRRRRDPEIDWHLYEASDRLGGTVETTRLPYAEGEFILEGGPDGWVSEKPWARELAIELGLEAELIASNDATRKTYIAIDGKLLAMPDKMRMMVPEQLSTLDGSALFSGEARAAYAQEIARADALKASAPQHDESVADFVLRHFGTEVLEKIGQPLLSGVFGGDVTKLSVQAVMAGFVAMEREHGSLIAALQAKAKARGDKPPQPIFTSLRRGVGSLVEAIVAKLPPERLHLGSTAISIKREGKQWCLRTANLNANGAQGKSKRHVHHLLLATPIDATRELLAARDPETAAVIPTAASSAVLAAFCWSAEQAATFSVPPGFGFLVPHALDRPRHLMAATFVDQKFPDRAPAGARVLRAFFGGEAAAALMHQDDHTVSTTALGQLREIVGPMPEPLPELTTVRRWPRSLPQYEVGHIERMKQLDVRVKALGGLTLLGNGWRGVGLPDLIRDARAAAREL